MTDSPLDLQADQRRTTAPSPGRIRLGAAAILLLLLAAAPALLPGEGSRLAAQEADAADEAPSDTLTEGLLKGLELRSIGPALTAGRIIDIAVDPTDRDTWYVAAASGGVWKTTNAGTTWEPIFDDHGSYSVGAVAVDPERPLHVWVGTGENNSQRSVGYGDGVYRSVDGGRSFERMGLEDSEHIGMIRFDPRNTDVVYVAAQGPLWADGGDRGLYRTTDGGESWERILEIDEHTGVSEVHLDPSDPEVLYAVAYQRRRHVWTLIDGGPSSGIWKSTDGGESWSELEEGLPEGPLGRIGMDVSPQRPNVLYAIVEAVGDRGGFYRSEDAGEHWERMSGYVSGSPQYYQEIFADPHRFDRVWSMDTYFRVSEDGGATWERVPKEWKHVDNHALIFDPDDPDHLLVGTDGGLYETRDGAENWRFFANLPITQFYKLGLSNEEPFYHVYGGTQDNNTQGGPVATRTVHGVTNRDWFVTVGGDGFDPAVDPEDPDIVYSQWQYGNLVRFDRKTGERIDIKPQEDADGPPLKFNWNSALIVSPHDPARLYYGAQFLFRSDDRGDSWERVSPDLTRQIDRNELEVMGRVWSVDAVAKNASTSPYGTIVALDESPLVEGLLYVGTDDGLVQVSEDGGESWREVASLPGVPDTSYISDIEASETDPDGVYVTVDNHKRGDFRPYVLRSDDRGRSWRSIAGDLPERGTAYTIVQDDEVGELLFVGTEFGLHVSTDGGGRWFELGGGIPTIAVRELEIQREEDDVAAATFGRGFWILDDYTPLRELARSERDVLGGPAHVFSVPEADLYIQSNPLGGGEKGSQGAGFYTAPNPPFGAVFTYYLREELKTRREARLEREAELREAWQDVRYPPWDTLEAEDREREPAVWLVVRDEAGNVVRRIAGSTKRGLHRASWGFRFPPLVPVTGRDVGDEEETLGDEPDGPLAVPGRYTVDLVRRVRGETETLVEGVPFRAEALGTASLPRTDRDSLLAFHRRVGALQRAALGAAEAASDAETRLETMREAILRTPDADLALLEEARELELRLADLRERLLGDRTKPRRNEPAMPGIVDRVQRIVYGSWNATAAPTGTQLESLRIAEDAYGDLRPELAKLLEEELPALDAKLEAAGAPWTPGRGVPTWPPTGGGG